MPKVNPVPQGLHTVTPNLTIKECAKAIEFYKRALGAEEKMLALGPDGKSIWHVELQIGDSVVFANGEMPGMTPAAPEPDRPSPVRLWLYVPDCDAAFDRAVKAGAKATMQPADMFWGDRCGMLSDPFGYEWTFATHVKDMTPDEMKKAQDEFVKEMSRQK